VAGAVPSLTTLAADGSLKRAAPSLITLADGSLSAVVLADPSRMTFADGGSSAATAETRLVPSWIFVRDSSAVGVVDVRMGPSRALAEVTAPTVEDDLCRLSTPAETAGDLCDITGFVVTFSNFTGPNLSSTGFFVSAVDVLSLLLTAVVDTVSSGNSSEFFPPSRENIVDNFPVTAADFDCCVDAVHGDR
jgi:hypothetical protein